MQKIYLKNFNLEHTLDSGQIFRYEKKEGYYFITTGNLIIKAKQIKSHLYYKTSRKVSEKFIREFFGLNHNLSKILLEINKDKHMNKAISKYRGIRIMNQDHNECIPSFIASAFSNIPKIKKSLNLMAEKFGKKIKLEEYTNYSFPEINKLNNLKKLKECSLGFRAERIYKLRNINRAFFENIRKMKYEDAKSTIMSLDGIGSKVADCILLFSFGFYESFPADIWIERIIKKVYLKNKKINIRQIEEFGRTYFGKYAGYAQQYLFHYARHLKSEFKK